jgi:hypothetical protein
LRREAERVVSKFRIIDASMNELPVAQCLQVEATK